MRYVPLILATFLLAVPGFAQKASEESPTDFFLRFESVWDQAKSVEDLSPLMAQEARDNIAETPPEMRKEMFAIMSEMRAKKVQVLSESRDGISATVTAKGVDEDGAEVKGTITLSIENGEWRLGKQSWSSGPE